MCAGIAAARPAAQTRLAILRAEDHRAKTPGELATLRTGARSADPQIRRIAVRALGRLERPSLIPDIVPSLRHALPEVRAEAANAVGQAAAGWKTTRSAAEMHAFESAVASLTARLGTENEPDVRAALDETIGRLPYASAAEAAAAEHTLQEAAGRAESVGDRLGIAKGFEALVRQNLKLRQPGTEVIALLERYAAPAGAESAGGARIRRLAIEALSSAHAVSDDLLASSARDVDAQVRRLAVREAVGPAAASADRSERRTAILAAALTDPSPMVRLEAMRAADCDAASTAAADADAHVALAALDRLSRCAGIPAAIHVLEQAVDDVSDVASPRGWHRAAHAVVALASASPDRAAAVLPRFADSKTWQLRMYAARSAGASKDRGSLEKLAEDDDDNVREAAVEALRRIAGHDADSTYVGELDRPGNQIVRAAAAALDSTPHPEAAVPALKKALVRLTREGRDNSHDARASIEKTLASIGAAEPAAKPQLADAREMTADDLQRLASPRARVTIRGVGTFDMALLTAQAPATVLRFARLAESGYYNGLTFHRVVANFVVQGGSPGANEYIGDASFMRDEVGLWPHVRGAVGISTRGRDTGDAQIFIDLVDNPRLDHAYTVFAQVLNGIDVVDRILEGDVIERIEILR
ncbi:MAG TPA: peptidylprolyl isomerase [Vicinamibacterales bacterium]|nr:peptidylprolyl isomerase [Vicinamibacterales bacterium]